MKFTLLLIASIAVSVYTADTPNCSTGNTASMFCYSCGASDCLGCVGGFLTGGKCTTVTAVTGCWEYSSTTACSMCNSGQYVTSDNKCASNPTSGATFVDKCAAYKYVGGTTAAVKCVACSGFTVATGELLDGVNTVATCSATALTGDCAISIPLTFAAPAARILADGSSRVLAATAAATQECYACSGTFVLDTVASPKACVAASDTLTAGCIKKNASGCTVCNPSSHQMREATKCTAKPTTGYSAILSVVSMIVALMFANF